MSDTRDTSNDEFIPVSSIWKLLLTTRWYKIHPINACGVILLALGVAIYSALMINSPKILSSVGAVISNSSFGFAATILGFLIAGFTIFATLTDKDLFIFMSKNEKLEYGVSYLRYTFNVFMDVFAQYIVLIIISLMSLFFFTSIDKLDQSSNIYGYISFSFLYTCASVLLISISSLISFIYNVYATIMFSLYWHKANSNSKKTNSGGTN